jgi:hypothetical protein
MLMMIEPMEAEITVIAIAHMGQGYRRQNKQDDWQDRSNKILDSITDYIYINFQYVNFIVLNIFISSLKSALVAKFCANYTVY